MRAIKKRYLRRKTMRRKRKSKRGFRKQSRGRRTRVNAKNTRKKKGGMEDDGSGSAASTRPPQPMISSGNFVADVSNSFPLGEGVYMSQQFPCSASASDQRLKSHPRDATIRLDPNGNVSMTWGRERWGATRVKTITGVRPDITSYSFREEPNKVYVGMTLEVTNEQGRPWFARDSSRDGCQFICKQYNIDERSDAISQFRSHAQSLRKLIYEWKGLSQHDRRQVIEDAEHLDVSDIVSGNPGLHALVRAGEFSLNIVGGILIIGMQMN